MLFKTVQLTFDGNASFSPVTGHSAFGLHGASLADELQGCTESTKLTIVTHDFKLQQFCWPALIFAAVRHEFPMNTCPAGLVECLNRSHSAIILATVYCTFLLGNDA